MGLLLWFATASGCARSAGYRVDFEGGETSVAVTKGKVAMVLSAAREQELADGSTRETGYFLNEFYEPYRALSEAGYEVQIVSPGGRAPSLDPESLDEKYWDDPDDLLRAQELIATLPQMHAPSRLEQLAARQAEFQALVVPGGQGVMVDLLDDPVLHGLIRSFADDHRPVGLICHAPAILARMSEPPEAYTGRALTSVSSFEEWYIERIVMGAQAQVRAIGSSLTEAGFRYEKGRAGRSNAVRDCSLVTSQNPFSSKAFNTLLLAALDDWRRGGRCVAEDDPAT